MIGYILAQIDLEHVGWIDLLEDRLVVIGDGDELLGRLLSAGDQAFKLCGVDCRQHLCAP
jgi:hypothetical protein